MGDAWLLNSPEESLEFVFADEGFDDFWDWSWQELARFDMSEMIRCIYSTTSSEVFIVGLSQGTIMSLAALTQTDIAEEVVEAAALFCLISYLEACHFRICYLLYIICSEWVVTLLDSICDGYVDCLEWLYLILLLIVEVSVLCSPIAGYLVCARCSSTGTLVLTEPVSTVDGGNQPLSLPKTERCSNCSGAGKVMCPTCLCTGMAMASEHDPRIDPLD
ncbi:triacylglycerol lipase 1-like [Pyrus communis]|uniref:triacylglycerol lipase 1-like n=1 Tax=Pyrus communis TaxID=23211 RepID=UPI0035BEEF9A